MFRAETWSAAFVNSAGTPLAAEEALQYLKVFCYAALMLPGDLSGRNDADRLGRSISTAVKIFSGQNKNNTGQPDGIPADQSFCLAERFVQLMLRKNCFHHYKKILRSIENIVDKQKGIEKVVVETAVDLDKEFLEILEDKTKKLIGAKKVALTQRIIPELIGGIRLRWGSLLFDGSVKRALEKMTLELKAQTT